MRHYRLSELSLSWFDSYLCNRTQQVNINENISENDKVRYGVPQGSILGPLLFVIFINDLLLTLKNVICSVDLYADDSTLYDIQLNKAQIENNRQNALDLLQTWCLENGMLLNIDKTKLMLIINRQRRNTFAGNDLTLLYNDVELQITCCEKLWVYILITI